MPLPSGVRLRESCEACTISKVKCSKDKPSCKRCTDRGSTCQYMVTQKTGRRRRQNSAKEDVSPPQQQPITPTSLPTPLPLQLDSNSGFGTCQGQFGDTVDILPNYSTGSEEFLTSLSATTDFSIPTIPSISHYGEINPPFDKGFDGFWLDDFSLLHSDSFTSTSASSDAGDAMAMEYSLSSDVSPPPTSQPTLNPAHMSKITGVDPAAATGIAIQLLEDLNSHREDLIHPTDGNPVRTEDQATRQRLEHLISKNRQVLQTIATILNPIGSQDGYVLVLICLILHKIVSTYGAALQCEHGTQCFKTCVIPSTFYEENPVALRQLVDELFQVRSSVTLVGKTIRLAAERSDALRTDNDSALATNPISITTLISMHEGLRKRLSVLSLRSIEGLKKFWA